MDSEFKLCTAPRLWIEHLLYNDAAVKSLRSASFGHKESETKRCFGWLRLFLFFVFRVCVVLCFVWRVFVCFVLGCLLGCLFVGPFGCFWGVSWASAVGGFHCTMSPPAADMPHGTLTVAD